MSRMWLIGLLMVAGLASCKGARPPEGERGPLQPFQAVTYVRTGGLAGADDRITITTDGTITTSGRLIGSSSGKLSEFQLMQLARVFEGWTKLQAEYPAPQGARDAFQYAITFGDKTVAASDASSLVPEQFITARQKIEQLARNLPATRPALR
jgi:hypothetical protein